MAPYHDLYWDNIYAINGVRYGYYAGGYSPTSAYSSGVKSGSHVMYTSNAGVNGGHSAAVAGTIYATGNHIFGLVSGWFTCNPSGGLSQVYIYGYYHSRLVSLTCDNRSRFV